MLSFCMNYFTILSTLHFTRLSGRKTEVIIISILTPQGPCLLAHIFSRKDVLAQMVSYELLVFFFVGPDENSDGGYRIDKRRHHLFLDKELIFR